MEAWKSVVRGEVLRALSGSGRAAIGEDVATLRTQLRTSEGLEAVEAATLLALSGDAEGASVLRSHRTLTSSRIETFYAKAALFLLDLPIAEELRRARSAFWWRDALVEECAFPRPPGPSIERAVLGAWEVYEDRGRGELLGLLILRGDAYAFIASDGGEVPPRHAARVVFIREAIGRARIEPARGLTLEQHLATVQHAPGHRPHVATMRLGQGQGEGEYAAIHRREDASLAFAPMFHVTLGVNEPPVVLRSLRARAEKSRGGPA